MHCTSVNQHHTVNCASSLLMTGKMAFLNSVIPDSLRPVAKPPTVA